MTDGPATKHAVHRWQRAKWKLLNPSRLARSLFRSTPPAPVQDSATSPLPDTAPHPPPQRLEQAMPTSNITTDTPPSLLSRSLLSAPPASALTSSLPEIPSQRPQPAMSSSFVPDRSIRIPPQVPEKVISTSPLPSTPVYSPPKQAVSTSPLPSTPIQITPQLPKHAVSTSPLPDIPTDISPQPPSQAMSSKSRLDIPEIMDIVASHLNERDFTRCLLVSKSWRDMFLPRVWRCIHRRFSPTVGGGRDISGPDQEVLHNHRHFVQRLSIEGPIEAEEMCTHLNLRTLSINKHMYGRMAVHNSPSTLGWNLAKKAPLLTSLSLDFVNVDPQLGRALSKLPHLRDLSLNRAEFRHDGVVLMTFLAACKNLESLSMEKFYFKGGFSPSPKDLVFEKLDWLRMDTNLSISDDLAMISHCPMLESFSWTTDVFDMCVSISHPVKENHWPESDDSDENLALIFNGIAHSIGKITEFELLGHSYFWYDASITFGLHFSTLVELDLHRSPGTSSIIQNVLCSCPNLEILSARDVLASYIVQGGPWVCRRLRELTMSIRVGQTQQLQHLVFERLSTLVRLRRFQVPYWVSFGFDCDNELDFRLDCGLSQLVSLQELTHLIFYEEDFKYTQRLRMEDVEWMVDNWKKLKQVMGYLDIDPKVDNQLKKVLRSHGITTSR